MTEKKKLIEVALPLEAINDASEHEKSVPRRGHPATMHLWWARRPLAACRAVLFSSLVDDPSSRPQDFPTEEAQQSERLRLFSLLERLIRWENSFDPDILREARQEIERSCGERPPTIFDPFAGGGTIPLEAQRMGLPVVAADLNPVAVLITKAMTEIPQRFAGRPPVGSRNEAQGRIDVAHGLAGLAEDIRTYGRVVFDAAKSDLAYAYPTYDGRDPIAWLWARTAICPNPACGGRMPLVSGYELSSKKGRVQSVRPETSADRRSVSFKVADGPGPESPKLGSGAKFRCELCGQVAPESELLAQATRTGFGTQLMAVVLQGTRNRTFCDPTPEQEKAAHATAREATFDVDLPDSARWFSPPRYGIRTYGELYSDRQINALLRIQAHVALVREKIEADARAAQFPDDDRPLRDGGGGARAYAEAISVYLALAIDKLADWSSSFCGWIKQIEGVRNTFARQAIPMVWDFVEVNPFSDSVGNFMNHIEWVADAVAYWPADATPAHVIQRDAVAEVGEAPVMVCTDPPYYDNIGYADLSDFFYLWLRRSVGDVYPAEFSTLLVPKSQELIASPYRFGGDKRAAERHFEAGLSEAFARLRAAADREFPVTIFYAFKQSEKAGESGAVASTGWEKMLEALLSAGFAINGTWPIRTERAARAVAVGVGALASSIVLVCRLRASDAPLATRKEFLTALKLELPAGVRNLQQGSVAPVDLAQAAIGPGMAAFSRYSKVVEADGSAMSVRTALGLINQVLDETLAEQEADFDPDTRWAVAWFEQYGMNAGPFGVAETLSKAKNTAVNGLVLAGILESKAGKVRLLDRDELPGKWDPSADTRLTVWELTQHLIRSLESDGESAAAALLRRVGGLGETARELAYRLYVVCERNKWAKDALAFNGLVLSWPEISRLAASTTAGIPTQQELL